MKRMLCVFAHPDDESFFAGIAIRKYVDSGYSVSLLVATSGEAGQSGSYGDIGRDELASIRKKELSEASAILGIKDVTVLPYPDGKLKEEPSGEFEETLYRKMVECSPQIVITGDTTGASNHPDHIRVCYSTTYAFQKYAGEIGQTRQFITDLENKNPDIMKRHFVSRHSYALKQESFAEIVESESQPKLYYSCLPASVVAYLQKKGAMPEESFGKPLIGTPDKLITTVIEGTREDGIAKMTALSKHVSQRADVDRFYEEESSPLTDREFYILRMHGTTEVFMGNNDTVSGEL